MKKVSLDKGKIKVLLLEGVHESSVRYFKDNGYTNIEYLRTQIGNPEGSENPNKKYYDPRKWLREGELTFKKRLEQAFEDLNNINTL